MSRARRAVMAIPVVGQHGTADARPAPTILSPLRDTMTATATTAAAPIGRRSSPGALAMTLAALAVLLLLIGGALVTIHLTQRDDAGYFSSSRFRLTAPGYARNLQGTSTWIAT